MTSDKIGFMGNESPMPKNNVEFTDQTLLKAINDLREGHAISAFAVIKDVPEERLKSLGVTNEEFNTWRDSFVKQSEIESL